MAEGLHEVEQSRDFRELSSPARLPAPTASPVRTRVAWSPSVRFPPSRFVVYSHRGAFSIRQCTHQHSIYTVTCTCSCCAGIPSCPCLPLGQKLGEPSSAPALVLNLIGGNVHVSDMLIKLTISGVPLQALPVALPQTGVRWPRRTERSVLHPTCLRPHHILTFTPRAVSVLTHGHDFPVVIFVIVRWRCPGAEPSVLCAPAL